MNFSSPHIVVLNTPDPETFVIRWAAPYFASVCLLPSPPPGEARPQVDFSRHTSFLLSLPPQTSPKFECGGFCWQILWCPHGAATNPRSDEAEYCSVFLQVAKDSHEVVDPPPLPESGDDDAPPDEPPPTYDSALWATRYAHFRFSFVPVRDYGESEEIVQGRRVHDVPPLTPSLGTAPDEPKHRPAHPRETSKRFHIADLDWGFRDFVKLDSLSLARFGLKTSDPTCVGRPVPSPPPLSQLFETHRRSTDRLSRAVAPSMPPPIPLNPYRDFEGHELVYTGELYCVILQCTIQVRHSSHLVDPLHYDSKLQTGYVGLKNQGCTCYLNSLLQTLFCLPLFRRLVYSLQIPDPSTLSIALALQKLFYRMQEQERAVGTRELTKSFGWNRQESFLQKDIQELMNVLFDRLENQDENIGRLFRGVSRGYVQCRSVNYNSSHDDPFLTLCLNVKGCNTIIESLRKYTERDDLSGENQYDTGSDRTNKDFDRYQDAERGTIFVEMPNVLIILLKRFEYDFNSGQLYKVNDRFEFPEELNVEEFVLPENRRSLNEAGEDVSNCEFELFSVMVHSGDLHSGHYWACIKEKEDDDNPNGSGIWRKFDDEKVYEITSREAVQGNYGKESTRQLDDRRERKDLQRAMVNSRRESQSQGQSQEDGDGDVVMMSDYRHGPRKNLDEVLEKETKWKSNSTRYTSAYVLVYVRKSASDQIFSPISQEDVPEYLPPLIQEEMRVAAEKKRQRERANDYVKFLVTSHQRLASLCHEDGLINKACFDEIAMLKEGTTLGDWKQSVEEVSGILHHQMYRAWIFVERMNGTQRPCDPIPLVMFSDDTPLNEIFELDPFRPHSYLLFIEPRPTLPRLLEPNRSIAPPELPDATNETLFLFFKFYDPHAEIPTLDIVGSFSCEPAKTLVDYLPALHTLAEGKSISSTGTSNPIFYEEVSRTRIVQVDVDVPLRDLRLRHGDVLVFQRKITVREKKAHRARIKELGGNITSLEVPDYYRYLRLRRSVLFAKYPHIETEVPTNAEVQKKATAATVEGPSSSSSSSSSEQRDEDGDVVMSSSTSDVSLDSPERLDVLRSNRVGDVARIIGRKYGVRASHIRFWAHNSYSNAPLETPLASKGRFYEQLEGKVPCPLNYVNEGEDPSRLTFPLAYYEILDQRLEEIKRKRKLLVSFRDCRTKPIMVDPGDGGEKVSWARIDRDGRMTVQELIRELRQIYSLPAQRIYRLYRIVNSAIVNVLHDPYALNEYLKDPHEIHCLQLSAMYQMFVTKTEGVQGRHYLRINVLHVDSSETDVRPFGDPFEFLISKVETLESLKFRLLHYLSPHPPSEIPKKQQPEVEEEGEDQALSAEAVAKAAALKKATDENQAFAEEFAKWQFVPVLGQLRLERIEDNDVVAKVFENSYAMFNFSVSLGLLHRDPKRQSLSGASRAAGVSMAQS